MKLGITGSRTNTAFDFTPVFTRQVEPFNAFLGRRHVSSIITGGARGIDRHDCSGAVIAAIAIYGSASDWEKTDRGQKKALLEAARKPLENG